MKKITLFLFSLIISLVIFCGLYVKADSITIAMTNGGSIRTTGNPGLKFEATASEDFDGLTEHGFYIAIGRHTKSEMTEAIAGGTGLIAGNKIIKKNTTGTDREFAVTIYDIPTENEGTIITAIAYYEKDAANVYSDICVSRNIITVAKALVDAGKGNDYIDDIAETAKVKTTTSASVVTYYASFNDGIGQIEINDGDTIDVSAGTYTSKVTISNNNVKIYGPNKNNGDFEHREDEADFTAGMSIASGVSGLEINGIKVSGSAAIQGNPAGNITDLTISYNNFSTLSKTRDGLAGPLYFSDTSKKNMNFVITHNNFVNPSMDGNKKWTTNYASTHAETAIFVQDVETFTFTYNNVYNFFNGIEVNEGGTLAVGLAGTVNINNNDFYNYSQLALQIKMYNVTTMNICDNIFNDLGNDGSDTAGAIRTYAEGANSGQVVNIIGNSFIEAWGWHMIRVNWNPSRTTYNVKYNLFKSDKHSSSDILVVQNGGNASDINAGYNCYLQSNGTESSAMLAKIGTVTSVGDNFSTQLALEAAYAEYLAN